MNVSGEQMEAAAADERTELMIPYKESGIDSTAGSVKYTFNYLKSQAEGIQTYVPVEGREPEAYHEIVVNKGFMDRIGQECRIGAKILLDVQGGVQEEFVICGYIDRPYDLSVYSIYVSREYADTSPLMADKKYTALLRITGAAHMESSGFETAVYQMAMDYGVKRPDVNINGRFEQSLQESNVSLYAAGLVSLFILAVSGIVIYSIFYLSVISRTQQIGQLQTIGMTQRQIKKMVRREGFLLSSISLPAALILGGIIAYFLQPDGWSFSNYAVTAVTMSIFGVLTVQISVGKPASLAAKVPPIEAARNSDSGEDTKKGAKAHKRLTAFVMAQTGQEQNHRKRRLMSISIASGGIIFMIAASYLYAWDEEAYSREGEFAGAEYIVSYLYSAHSPAAYGSTEMQLVGHLSGELREKLLKIPHVRSVNAVNSAFGNIEYQGASWVQGFYRLTKEEAKSFNMNMDGNSSYDYLCEHDGIIITDSEFISGINGVSFQPGDMLTLHWFDGEEHQTELEITAVTSETMPAHSEYNICMTDKTMEKLWGAMNTVSSFSIAAKDYEKYGEQIEQDILTVIEPYPDLSLETLREKRIDDSANIQKIKIQIYGISVFVTLFSILNLINMLAGNIAARKKEFSILESIGMEEKQIRGMLFWESVIFVLPALLIIFTAGSAAGYAVVSFLQKSAGYMEYRFPLIPGMVYIIGMVLIPLTISYFGLKGQSRVPLVERIRNTEL